MTYQIFTDLQQIPKVYLLIEAAACGLPIVATHDGGPKDIIGTLNNGVLIDPMDTSAIADGIDNILSNKVQWGKMSKNGMTGAIKYYSWDTHIKQYIEAVKNVISKPRRVTDVTLSKTNRLPTVDRMLVCDIDNTLIGDKQALQKLQDIINGTDGKIGFGVATGRNLESTQKILKQWKVPTPDLLITAVGSEIHYGHRMLQDSDWQKHINYRWQPAAIKKAIKRFPGLKMQAASEQLQFKISFNVDPDKVPPMREISAYLRQHDIHVKLIYSHEAYLDVMPIRASKGLAVRYIAMKWGITPDRILVAGDSGNDEEMLKGNTLGVVVGNYSKELAKLKGRDRIYFAEQEFAHGVIEGMEHYRFLVDINKTDAGSGLTVSQGQLGD
jgi:sucrose-phosphate synthase